MPNQTPVSASQALVVRLSRKTISRVDRAARARGLKRSEFVREVIESSLGAGGDLAAEARRQSLLVGNSRDEREVDRLLEGLTDTQGWR